MQSGGRVTAPGDLPHPPFGKIWIDRYIRQSQEDLLSKSVSEERGTMKELCRVTATLLLIVLLAATVSAQGKKKPAPKKAPPKAAPEISFAKTILPILRVSCLPCHTEDAMNPSQLYLDTYENIMTGGKHGKAVVPGNAAASLFMQKLGADVPFGDPMPLKRKSLLSADTIGILRTWINQGAKNN